MPILVTAIEKRMNQALDSENSERYLFEQDFKPAINSAKDIIVTLLNEAFAKNKISPESLRELSKIKIWQASQYSRVSFSAADVGHSLWTILAVYPNPVCNRAPTSTATTDKSKSIFRKDISFVSSTQSAKRLNFEEWNENIQNAFMPGNNVLASAGGLQEYAYLDFADYSSTSYTGNNGLYEITIRPAIPGGLVALAYLKYPSDIANESDSVEFPESLTQLITDIALNQIAIKQGDNTNLYGTAKDWINNLTGLLK